MATTTDVRIMLEEHDFLKGALAKHLDALSEFAGLRTFHAGDYLFRTGEQADCCYLIRSGHVAIEIEYPPHGSHTIQTAGPGKVLGWSWLLEPYTWAFHGRAVELTRGICLDAAALRASLEADHELGYAFLKRFTGVFGERLESARLQLLDIYGRNDAGGKR